MRLAAVQMTSLDDVGANLRAAGSLLAEAAAAGAELVALPENFAYLRREGLPIPCAQGLDGEIVGFLRDAARRHGLWLLGGSFPEVADEGRVFNTSLLLSPEGAIEAAYRKIHLFDVDLRPQGGSEFRESARIAPGQEVVVAKTPFGGLGLSICYDLRFPELYRAQSERGVRLLAVPAAFAVETGRDHWEVLLRARAIENQVYLIAPDQFGKSAKSFETHGHSMIVDPWGKILAELPDGAGVITAEIDLEYLVKIRAELPSLKHRRL